MKSKNKKSQVWVETVIYTLIALTIIGLFLTFARPKIEQIQDKAVIEQSVDLVKNIDTQILNMVQQGAGNQRTVEIGIKKGSLTINSSNDEIYFEVESKYQYTEPGTYVQLGKVIAYTENVGGINRVKLISNYSNIYNITYNGGENEKLIPKSQNANTLLISNKGKIGSYINIDFSLV